MTEACAPPRDGEDAAAVIRRLESLSAYLTSLERVVAAMEEARLGWVRDDLVRNVGQRCAASIATREEESARLACDALRQVVVRLEAQRDGQGAGQ